MNKRGERKQSGIIQIIVLILIALLIMKFLDITVSEVINWFKTTFGSILK